MHVNHRNERRISRDRARRAELDASENPAAQTAFGPIVLAAPVDTAASPEMSKRFQSEGAEQFAGKPEDLQRVFREELETWRRVVREGGLKLD